MQAIEQCFGEANIKEEADREIAQLTPNRADLNDYGRRVLAPLNSTGQTLPDEGAANKL